MISGGKILLKEYEPPYGYFNVEIDGELTYRKVEEDTHLRKEEENQDLQIDGITRLIRNKSDNTDIRVSKFEFRNVVYFGFGKQLFLLNSEAVYVAKKKNGIFSKKFTFSESSKVIIDLKYSMIDEVDDVLSYVVDELRSKDY